MNRLHLRACESLAAQLSVSGYRAWVEISRVGVQSYGDAGRIDVLALLPWSGRTTFEMVAFEVKLSRSDFLADVTAGKWRRYVSEYGIPRVAFAFYDGAIAKVSDVPSDAGLWVRDDDGMWKRRKAPRPLADDQRKIDPLLLLQMLSQLPYDGERAARVERAKALRYAVPDVVAAALDGMSDKALAEHVRHRLGSKIGHKIATKLAAATRDAKVQTAAYVEHVLDAVARFEGVTIEDVRARAAAFDGPMCESPLARALSHAVGAAERREQAAQLIQGLSALLVDRYGSTYTADAVATAFRSLADVNTATAARVVRAPNEKRALRSAR